MTVAANCKQVLTIAIAVFLFNLKINFTNGIGIVLTLIGGVSTASFSLTNAQADESACGPDTGLVRLAGIPRGAEETTGQDRKGTLDVHRRAAFGFVKEWVVIGENRAHRWV